MNYDSAAEIAGALLALLFLIYARSKKRGVKKMLKEDRLQNPYDQKLNNSFEKPDLISKTASGIYKAHKLFNQIMGVIFVGVVLIMAVFEPLVRIIVISTVALMLMIALIWKMWTKRN